MYTPRPAAIVSVSRSLPRISNFIDTGPCQGQLNQGEYDCRQVREFAAPQDTTVQSLHRDFALGPNSSPARRADLRISPCRPFAFLSLSHSTRLPCSEAARTEESSPSRRARRLQRRARSPSPANSATLVPDSDASSLQCREQGEPRISVRWSGRKGGRIGVRDCGKRRK